MIITDLQVTDAANCRAPGQLSDDLATAGERVEGHAMLDRPTILRRSGEHRAIISDIGVLERELPNSEVGEPVDVFPNHLFAVDLAMSHHAGGPDGQPAGCIKEFRESRRRFAHQTAIECVIEMMS
jgi:hypothetical protein